MIWGLQPTVLAGTEGQELLDYHPCAVAAGAGGIFGRIAGQSGQMAPAAWRLVRVLESRSESLGSGMDVSKNRGKTPKMDGEYHYFWKHPYNSL